ncbi:hypothetical protein IKA92_01565 [bacterium]|nr:hypothetical protein [bacterium]
MKINQRLMSLQSYASNVTNGVMNTGKPGWLGSAGIISPYERARFETDMFIRQNGMLDPKTGKYYMVGKKGLAPISPQKIFLDFLHRASNAYIEQLREYLHKVEKKLTHDRDQISTQIKMLDAEYNANKSAISNAIKESAPQYV